MPLLILLVTLLTVVSPVIFIASTIIASTINGEAIEQLRVKLKLPNAGMLSMYVYNLLLSVCLQPRDVKNLAIVTIITLVSFYDNCDKREYPRYKSGWCCSITVKSEGLV